jgi:hypothetical protein
MEKTRRKPEKPKNKTRNNKINPTKRVINSEPLKEDDSSKDKDSS